MAKTVVFDFDGVIHSYTSGWQGATNIPDPPVPGIQEALKEIHDAGYEVVVVSTRCKTALGRMAIENWIDMYGMTQEVDKVCKEKPPAIAYIDDRAICFDGHPETLLKKIQSFEPWYKMPTLTPQTEWVSVEERPPKAEKEVRLFCITPNGYKYQCQGFYVPPGTLRDDSGYSWAWECCDECDEDSDDYFVNPGWYESCHNWDEYSAFRVADKVTHWMPLPAPPGEDNNVPTNKPLTLERVAKEFLVICGNDCVGDPSVGIPPCPFFRFKDVEDNGAIIDPKCELAAYRRPPEGEEGDENRG